MMEDVEDGDILARLLGDGPCFVRNARSFIGVELDGADYWTSSVMSVVNTSQILTVV